jgi:hypothetical protein
MPWQAHGNAQQTLPLLSPPTSTTHSDLGVWLVG